MSHVLDLVDSFLARVIDVLREVACVDASVVRLAGPAPDGVAQIAVIIRARGDLSGMTWSFPVEVARRVAVQMVPGIDPDPAICEAAAAELANVLTGRGLVYLAERGMQIEIEPPEIAPVSADGVAGALGTAHGTIEVVFHGTHSWQIRSVG